MKQTGRNEGKISRNVSQGAGKDRKAIAVLKSLKVRINQKD